MTDAVPLISCLCVTHDRVALLKRAVACFLAQTLPNCELLIVHEERDRATAAYAANLDHPNIRVVEVPMAPRLTLGGKRNLGVSQCRGAYVAVWDDDDWHAPSRLATQLQVIQASGLKACTVRQLLLFDHPTGDLYLTQIHHWECTLVCALDAMPPYADLERGEDSPCVAKIAERLQLAWIDAPQLYVYTYHGRNVGGRSHFRRHIYAFSDKLKPELAARVADVLARPVTAPPLTFDEVKVFLPAPAGPQ